MYPGSESHIHVPFPQIGRTQVSDIYTYQAHKNYRPCYQKGRVRPGMETLPFGYRLQIPLGDLEDGERRPPGEVDDDDDGDRLARFPGGSNWNRDQYQQTHDI